MDFGRTGARRAPRHGFTDSYFPGNTSGLGYVSRPSRSGAALPGDCRSGGSSAPSAHRSGYGRSEPESFANPWRRTWVSVPGMRMDRPGGSDCSASSFENWLSIGSGGRSPDTVDSNAGISGSIFAVVAAAGVAAGAGAAATAGCAGGGVAAVVGPAS